MGRVTRKQAAELVEALHIDEDAVLELGGENALSGAKELHVEPSSRAPLSDLEPNSGENNSQSDDATQELKQSTRSKKGGRKGARGKNSNLAASITTQPDTLQDALDRQEVIPDENESTPSPASEKAAEDLMRNVSDSGIAHIPVQHPIPQKRHNKAVTFTRSQLGKQTDLHVEPKSLVDGIGQTPEERESMREEFMSPNMTSKPDIITIDEDATLDALPVDAPTSPLANAMPKTVVNLRADTPAKRSTSNKENIEPQDMESPQPPNYDALETAVVSASTPQAASADDPIAALDEIDDAVESVNNNIPDVQTSPEKAKSPKETIERRPSKRAAPVVRPTKASQARLSLAQNSDTSRKAPTLGKPRPSMTLGCSSSVRQTSGSKPDLASKRVPSGSTEVKAAVVRERKEVVIPHSKTRPISMSFPTPPPPTKSTKAPTQSAFQLPGAAVAAKLKAAREARMQKEGEEEQKKAFKARPVPSSLSRAPSIRQTASSRARESLMTGKDTQTATSVVPSGGHKRAQSVATSHPSAPKPRVPSNGPSKLSASTSRPPLNASITRNRPSTALAGLSKPRSSLAPSASISTSTNPTTSGQRITSNPTKGTSKGKEVFNRAAAAKAAAEKEKQEKESAAKKARAEAAERGRQASRDWAERQKLKKNGGASKEAGAASEVKEEAVLSSNEAKASPVVEASPMESEQAQTEQAIGA